MSLSKHGWSELKLVCDSQEARREPPTRALVAALLELARSTAEDELDQVLDSVANAVLVTSGYRVVVLNVFRPAWDDYEAVLVLGEQDSVDTVLGSLCPRETIERLLATGDELLPGVYLLTEDTPVWEELDRVYTPDLPTRDLPDAWQSEDALVVMLRDSGGAPLGFVSVDEPRTGKRPKKSDLQLLRVVCTYAEQALRAAQRSHQAEGDKRLLKRLSELFPLLSRCESREELYGLVTAVVVSDLGFERVALYSEQSDGKLSLRQSLGWEPGEGLATSLSRGQLDELLVPQAQNMGCWLIDSADLRGVTGSGPGHSRRNGVGPLAWADQALLIPWFSDSHALTGVVVVEDPVDHLLPSAEQCRAARLLMDLATSVAGNLQQHERLVQEASYDSLTGLRNRRGLNLLITSNPSVALLLCDIDHFKKVNDEYGHVVGDRVLERLGQLLNELTVGGGVPIRLGGEEFCVVFPDIDGPDAVIAAERLRERTAATTREIVPAGVTISIGVAASHSPVLDPGLLLGAADRALYEAKRRGRNRVVLTEQ